MPNSAARSGISTRKLDVLNDAAVKAAFEAIGPVDVLFNCAGFVHAGTILEMKDEDLDFAFNLNVRAMVRTIRAVLPGMIERGGGAIVNMASVASSITGVPNRFAYGTTKAAVIGLTKSVAADYVAKGIRCNAICPGTVESPSLEGRMRAQGDYDKARAAFIARQPMGRLGTPGGDRRPRGLSGRRDLLRRVRPTRSTAAGRSEYHSGDSRFRCSRT